MTDRPSVAPVDLGLNTEWTALRRSAQRIVILGSQGPPDREDGTAAEVQRFASRYGVRHLECLSPRAACARNLGAAEARGRVLVFVDADTRIPERSLERIHDLVVNQGYLAGMFRLIPLENSSRARLWWKFWEHVRGLPIPRAKAMSGFMFCERSAFERHGPFDESVVIGEEWPVLAGLYRAEPGAFLYDRTLAAATSNRRMTLQRFGYARTLLRYGWAILHESGCRHYPDTFRHSKVGEPCRSYR